LQQYSGELYNHLLNEPSQFLPLAEEAARQAVVQSGVAVTGAAQHSDVEGQSQLASSSGVHTIQVLLRSEQRAVPIRMLKAVAVGHLVHVSGLIVSSSRVQAKVTRLVLQCRQCKTVRVVEVRPGLGGAEVPTVCPGPTTTAPQHAQGKCPHNPYIILPDKCSYVDQQILKLQESPETVPTGEIPRHITLVIDRHLVGRAVPGTRVSVYGIYTIYKGADKQVKAVAIRHPYLRVVGLVTDSEGVGRVSHVFSDEEVQHFTELARTPGLYQLITKSIAPAIYGHEDVKRVLACQLFGGCCKILPDGMRLRGDINVLLLGDPGTAKSQFLKFVERLAPIGVYTSGKGSSAAGLTASVIRDASTREFYLEGGAMVLADGGIVCIDEFDKMRPQDRVAIHEAMEQQTISIAKAGITTILNARSAVLAAANPQFGRYDELRSQEENFTEFRHTILSRFDCIFLIKDTRNELRDRIIAEHVMSVHMRATTTAALTPTTEPDFDLFKLKRYIAFCRAKCAPRLTAEAAEILVNQYVMMRAQHRTRERHGESNAIPLTVRQLEAIVRLAEALAKMTLSKDATETHVEEAIRLFTVSTVDAINSGAVVLEEMNDTIRSEVENVERLIKRRLAIGASMSERKLVDSLVKTINVSETAVRRTIQILVQRDELEYRARRHIVYRKR
jgi:DNA replication licensing factor MCM5